MIEEIKMKSTTLNFLSTELPEVQRILQQTMQQKRRKWRPLVQLLLLQLTKQSPRSYRVHR